MVRMKLVFYGRNWRKAQSPWPIDELLAPRFRRVVDDSAYAIFVER